MKYFLDTEFIEYPCTIDLISIGIVSEDNRSYYAISTEFEPSKANNWVKENVLNKLPVHPNILYKSRTLIKEEIIEFIIDKPEFYGYYADYDWVVFCWLFGSMINLPKSWPMYCKDIKQIIDDKGNPRIPFKSLKEHNALSDVIWTKRVYEWIIKL
jgi:3' exoribonuclease, RNase T-like